MPTDELARRTKICIAASAGGHLAEILKTAPAWDGCDVFFVTSDESARGDLRGRGDVRVVGDANRFRPLRAAAVLFRCLQIMFRERPDAVFSTGALPGCLACLAGRLVGAKVVWLDSFTNIDKLSLSGRIVKPFADLFLVQWPELAERCPGAEHVGSVL
jgi:hypothetical protein